MTEQGELVQELRAAGYRLTPQRLGVLTALASSAGHMTAEEILARVRSSNPYLNKSAVYRSLDLLTHLGLVTQTDLGQGCIEYELHRHPHHHHLICRECGSRTQVEHALLRPLERTLMETHGFAAELDHFAIYGFCKKCRRKK
ncbi:MAG: Fur family transcriptional regulator [Rudaea sp.]